MDYKCLCLDKIVSIVYSDIFMHLGKCSLSESVESEHGLVDPEELNVLIPGGFNSMIHLCEKVHVMRVLEINHYLAASDEFESYSVSLVSLVQEIGGYPDFWKLSVKHYHSLLKRQVSPGIQSLLAAEKLDLLF